MCIWCRVAVLYQVAVFAQNLTESGLQELSTPVLNIRLLPSWAIKLWRAIAQGINCWQIFHILFNELGNIALCNTLQRECAIFYRSVFHVAVLRSQTWDATEIFLILKGKTTLFWALAEDLKPYLGLTCIEVQQPKAAKTQVPLNFYASAFWLAAAPQSQDLIF